MHLGYKSWEVRSTRLVPVDLCRYKHVCAGHVGTGCRYAAHAPEQAQSSLLYGRPTHWEAGLELHSGRLSWNAVER